MHPFSHLLKFKAPAKEPLKKALPAHVELAAKMLVETLNEGGGVYACGNGGSAEQCNHLVAELVGRFKSHDRPPLHAVSLASNVATITAIANDFGFEEIFERQVLATVGRGDALVAFTTSGTSKNVVRAVKAANTIGAKTIAFTRYDVEYGHHDNVARFADLTVPLGIGTAEAQEQHLKCIHQVCEVIDEAFDGKETVRARS